MKKKNHINIGIIGLGSVGLEVVKLLFKNYSLINQKAGVKIVLKKVCDIDKSKFTIFKRKGFNTAVTTKYKEIIADKEIDIVVELIGGYHPPKEIIIESIKKGKHIVTANKAVLAKYWNEIFSFAYKNKVLVYFEASVGAGIPIIQAINEGLAANRINAIVGILNGTSNYILTQMSKKNVPFDVALKRAKEAGFAETNPYFDIKGIDTLHKLIILGSIAFGTQLKLEDAYCEGIDGISPVDIEYGKKQFGYTLKLLGILRRKNNLVELRVHPAFLPADSLLSDVDNEFNAIYVESDTAGPTLYYGKGAGAMSAASGVVSDIIFIAQKVNKEVAGEIPYILCTPGKNVSITNINRIETNYYIRFTAIDKPGVLSQISGVLGKNNVSISAVYQKGRKTLRDVPIIMTTHLAREGNLKKALSHIDKLPIIKRKTVFIRIEERK